MSKSVSHGKTLDKKGVEKLAKSLSPGKKITCGPGLILRKTPESRLVWIVRVQINGKEKIKTLGNYEVEGRGGAMTFRQALATSGVIRDALKESFDEASKDQVIPEKPSEDYTVEKAINAAMEFRRPTWKPRLDGKKNAQLAAWERARDNTFAPILKVPMDLLTVEQVAECLKTRWFKQQATAKKEREIIAASYDYWLEKTESSKRNPLTKRAIEIKLDKPLIVKTKPKVIPTPADLRKLFKSHNNDSPEYWSAVLMVSTVARVGEVTYAQEPMFNLQRKVWKRPEWLMKMGVPAPQPLTDTAVMAVTKLLAMDDRPKGFNPDTNRQDGMRRLNHLNRDTITHWMKTKGLPGAHKTRDAFKTWAEDRGFNDKHVDICMAHIGADTYNHAEYQDILREILTAWEAEVFGP